MTRTFSSRSHGLRSHGHGGPPARTRSALLALAAGGLVAGGLVAGALVALAWSATSALAREVPHGTFHAQWEMNVPGRGYDVVLDLDHVRGVAAGHGALSIGSRIGVETGAHCPPDRPGVPEETTRDFCDELYDRARRHALDAEVLGVRYAPSPGPTQAVVGWSFADEEAVRLAVIDLGTNEFTLLHPDRGVDAQHAAIRRPHFCEVSRCQGDPWRLAELIALPDERPSATYEAMGPTADLDFLRRFRNLAELRVPGAESEGDEVPPDWDRFEREREVAQNTVDVSSIQGEWTAYDAGTGEALLELDLYHTPGDPNVSGSAVVVGGPLVVQGARGEVRGAAGFDATDLRLFIGAGTSRLVFADGNGPILSGTLLRDGAATPVELRAGGMPPPQPTPSPAPAPVASGPVPWAPRFGGATLSYWNHNGSGMAWESDGDRRWVWYYAPREGLRGVGVRPGTLLFEGRRAGRRMVGTAYTFSGPCGPAGFRVEGPIGARDESVQVSGAAPRRDEACNVVDRRTERLGFEFLSMRPDGVGAAEIETHDMPGVGVSGTGFRATDLPPGDVLNMRIDPDPRAEIVGRLTGREVVTVLRCTPDVDAARWEEAGYAARRAMIRRSWCLAAWDDMEGWVYGRYLEPLR